MASFENTPEYLDGDSAQASATLENGPLSSAQMEQFQQLDQDPGVEFTNDMEQFEQVAQARAAMLKERLDAYQAEHPGVDISEVAPSTVLEPEEMAVMEQEAQAAEKAGINWWNVMKGVLVVGGVAAAAYFFLPGMGYSFKAGELIGAGLDLALNVADKITGGLEVLGNGMVSVYESVAQWNIWTELGNLFGADTLENVQKAIEGGSMGPDFLPTPDSLPFDPGMGKLPPIG